MLNLKEPHCFGYLNSPVEKALKALGEWPRFPRGSGPGDRLLVNAILNELADKTGLARFPATVPVRLAGGRHSGLITWPTSLIHRATSLSSLHSFRAVGAMRPGDGDGLQVMVAGIWWMRYIARA